MARRRSSNADDFFDACCGLFQILPPWTSIPGAIVVFLFPTWLFGRIQFPGFKEPPFLILGMILGGFGAIACLLGGFKSWQRRNRQQEFVGETVDLNWVNRLSWQEFEQQLASVYRQDGYLVEEFGGSGPDGGVDLRLTRGNERVLVQCKHWKSWKVGVPVVRELYGVLMAEGATKAILITSGRISGEAETFAEGKPMELVSGDELLVLLRRFQRKLAVSLGQPIPEAKAPAFQTVSTAPACPRCGEGMLIRVAKKGANAGGEFWGCPKFPRCNGTRPKA
jgi:restriction system protein